MNPIAFNGHNVVFAKDQPQYRQLPAFRLGDMDGTVVFCWSLTWRERLQVLLTGRVWHQVLTFHGALQPQLLTTEKPEIGKPTS